MERKAGEGRQEGALPVRCAGPGDVLPAPKGDLGPVWTGYQLNSERESEGSRDSCARALRPKALLHTQQGAAGLARPRGDPPKTLSVMLMGTPTHGHSNCPTSGPSAKLAVPPAEQLQRPLFSLHSTPAAPVTFPTVPDGRAPSCLRPTSAWQPRGSFHTSKSGHGCLLLRASLMPYRFRTTSEIPTCPRPWCPLSCPCSLEAPAFPRFLVFPPPDPTAGPTHLLVPLLRALPCVLPGTSLSWPPGPTVLPWLSPLTASPLLTGKRREGAESPPTLFTTHQTAVPTTKLPTFQAPTQV